MWEASHLRYGRNYNVHLGLKTGEPASAGKRGCVNIKRSELPTCAFRIQWLF